MACRPAAVFLVTPNNSAVARPNSGEDRAKHQVSAYELYSAARASSADKTFASQEINPFAGGEFGWTGWDYLREPTPFDSSRSSYFGIIDLAGFKKDRFYLYQAHWRPDFPMAHILPHWTWPERVGQITPVHVFTPGDEGELVLNGKYWAGKGRARTRIVCAGTMLCMSQARSRWSLTKTAGFGRRTRSKRPARRPDSSSWSRIAARSARMEEICRS